MANYGNNERPEDLIPDWLLGGNRKRLLVSELVENPRKLGPKGLADHLGCGRTTAYETIRALRALHVIEQDRDDGVKLLAEHPLTKAIKALVKALEPFAEQRVDRPPRQRRATQPP